MLNLKKIVPILILLLCPFISIGQEKHIGIKLTPNLSYRTLDGSNADGGDLIVEHRNQHEKAMFSYSLGLDYLHALSEEFSLRGGIQYSSKGYKFRDEPESPRVGTVHRRYTYNYLDIPVRAQFYLSSLHSLRFYFAGGISTNLLLSSTTAHNYEKGANQAQFENNSEEKYLRDVNFQGIIGFGIQAPIGNNFHLSAEPVFRHSFTSIVDEPVKGYLWSLGAEIGLYYEF